MPDECGSCSAPDTASSCPYGLLPTTISTKTAITPACLGDLSAYGGGNATSEGAADKIYSPPVVNDPYLEKALNANTIDNLIDKTSVTSASNLPPGLAEAINNQIYNPPVIKDAYGNRAEAVVQEAAETYTKYLEKALNADTIYDLMKATTVTGTDQLPPNIGGLIHTEYGINPLTGEKTPVQSDIFYNNELPEYLQLYALLHEYTHLGNTPYTDLPLAFMEGDSEYMADNLTDSSINYPSDPTYQECDALITDIYEAIGKGDPEKGRELFYSILDKNNDFVKTLDSFESSLKSIGGIDHIYKVLDILKEDLNAKYSQDSYKEIPKDTPYTPQDILDGMIGNHPAMPQTIHIARIGEKEDPYKLLKDAEDILKQYVKIAMQKAPNPQTF